MLAYCGRDYIMLPEWLFYHWRMQYAVYLIERTV